MALTAPLPTRAVRQRPGQDGRFRCWYPSRARSIWGTRSCQTCPACAHAARPKRGLSSSKRGLCVVFCYLVVHLLFCGACFSSPVWRSSGTVVKKLFFFSRPMCPAAYQGQLWDWKNHPLTALSSASHNPLCCHLLPRLGKRSPSATATLGDSHLACLSAII